MTDANGSTSESDVGTPDPTKGGGNQGSQANASDPFSGLDTGTREWVEKAGIKDVKSVVDKARNAEALIGKSVQLPGENAKPEDWDKFYSRLGRPEKADGYEFKLPDGLPADMPYDNDFAGKFKAASHAAGLTAKQAASLHDFYAKEMGAGFEKSAADLAAKAKAATEALEAHFGGKSDSDEFKRGVQLASRALRESGGDDLIKALSSAGLIGQDGIVLDPVIAKTFHAIGQKLYTEDGHATGSAAQSGDNPFAGDADKLNWTNIHKEIRSDPDRARRLISAAGKKAEDFGLKPIGA